MNADKRGLKTRSAYRRFTEALECHLRRCSPAPGVKPWEAGFGALKDLRRENRRIEQLIEAEFGTIDETGW